MSYASAVRDHGPKQTDAEKVPDAIPEIAHSDSGVHSIDSLTSEASQIPSFADQQLAKERHDAQDAAAEGKKEAEEFGKKADDDLQRLEAQAGKKYQEWSQTAKDDYQKVKKQAGVEGRKAKENAKEAEDWADKNKGNPVVVGNAVVLGALAALLGTGAYRMNRAGTLTWKVASAWTGVVGLFAVGDYYVSQYFFKKYPPKH